MSAAIEILKDKEPGSFIVRDSHSFKGFFGLALKVAVPPASVLQGDISEYGLSFYLPHSKDQYFLVRNNLRTNLRLCEAKDISGHVK